LLFEKPATAGLENWQAGRHQGNEPKFAQVLDFPANFGISA
jgi:hypothetical protein